MSEIVELGPGDPRLDRVWPVMQELRDHLSTDDLDRLYAEAHDQGYRLLASFEGAECLGVATYRLGLSFANGRYLYVEDLVTTSSRRSAGRGKALMDEVVRIAAAHDCDCVTLDSGVHRFGAHRFYLREGFVISSHHFHKALKTDALPSSGRVAKEEGRK